MSKTIRTGDFDSMRMGLLQTVQLARAYAEQAERLRGLEERSEALEAELRNFRGERERIGELIELGEREVGRLRDETVRHLGAITLHTQDEDRMARLESLLQRDDLSPAELVRWHERISEEFRLLYPTRPVSEPVRAVDSVHPIADSLAPFRLRGHSE